jgi:hypothetical protein
VPAAGKHPPATGALRACRRGKEPAMTQQTYHLTHDPVNAKAGQERAAAP